jgi:hypothetical protein
VTETQVTTANIHKGVILMTHLPFGENIKEISYINVRYSVFMSVTETPHTIAITTAITVIMLATHMQYTFNYNTCENTTHKDKQLNYISVFNITVSAAQVKVFQATGECRMVNSYPSREI